ncbi:MAG TPA: hypothetical protein VN541_11880 [Tepidisphaeraceae bacterium]|nr:hypothetical protein [Tepidisphaeraceae bacterium]
MGWVRPESCADFESMGGLVRVTLFWDSPSKAGVPHWLTTRRIYWHPPNLFYLQVGRTKAAPEGTWRFGNRRLIIASVPYWFLVAATAVLPLCWLAPRLKRKLRTRSGFCPGCGYNLTANTTGICSECGVTVTEAVLRRDRRARRTTIVLAAVVPLVVLAPFAGRTALDHYREHAAWKRLLAVQRQYLNYTVPPDRIAYTEDPATGRRLLSGDPNYASIGNCVCYMPPPVRAGIPGFFIGANGGPPLFLHARRTGNGATRLVALGPISVQDAEDLRADVIVPASNDDPAPQRLAESQLVLARSIGQHFTFMVGQPDPSDSSHFTIVYSIDHQPGTIDGWLLDAGGVKLLVRDGPAQTLRASAKAGPFKSAWGPPPPTPSSKPATNR